MYESESETSKTLLNATGDYHYLSTMAVKDKIQELRGGGVWHGKRWNCAGISPASDTITLAFFFMQRSVSKQTNKQRIFPYFLLDLSPAAAPLGKEKTSIRPRTATSVPLLSLVKSEQIPPGGKSSSFEAFLHFSTVSALFMTRGGATILLVQRTI